MAKPHTNEKKPSLLYKMGLSRKPYKMDCDYRADGLGVKNRSLSFLTDPVFSVSWDKATSAIFEITGDPVPDAFAAERNLMVAALPTGQGILIKP